MKKIMFLPLIMASVMFSFGEIVSIEISNSVTEILDNKTETFKVYGNCGMCEKTIEGSLKSIKGIEKADWNKETKMMEATFDPAVISLKEIKQKIATVGYDTDEVRATNKAYNGLARCCQYERPESKKEEHNHTH